MTLIAPKPQAHEALSHADKKVIANVLTWDMQQLVSPEEVEALAIVHDIVWVKLTDNRAIPLHVETFRAIRHQQLEEQAVDEVERVWGGILPPQISREYVTQLEAKLEADEKEIEIDSTSPGVYRIWKNMTFIGTVRRCSKTLCWIAKPLGDNNGQPYLTSAKAIAAVVEAI